MLRALALGLCISLAGQAGWALCAEVDLQSGPAQTGGFERTAYAWSDFDHDGDVDLPDFDVFSGCFAGPDVAYDPPPSGCPLDPDGNGFLAADWDKDGDVDLVDFAVFQECYSGAGNPADPSCGESAANIVLNGSFITADSLCVTVEGTKATITCAGTYYITGTLTNGQIVVNTQDAGLVELIFNGINISNSTTAPLYVMSAANTAIVLADQTVNFLSDATTYVYPDPNDPEPDAALFSKDPLTISGTGALTVHGNYLDGIAGKDDLIIASGTINVIAVDDGIRGRDYLLVQNGNITVTSQGDGVKATNDTDPNLGYVQIDQGTFHVTSGGDAITAETDVTIADGNFTIVSGGGHTVTIPTSQSAKAIKGLGSVTIGGGTFSIDAADDGLHSNGAITVGGGNVTIATNSSTTASYGDGVHADGAFHMTGGTITVTTAYEGIESSNITIDNGTFHVTTTDDGINAAGLASPNNHIYINGGYVYVTAAGDGIDSNGSLAMTGGTVIVNGPTANDNSAIDCDSTFSITGGFLVAAGSKQMAQAPNGGTQRSVKITYGATKSAGTLMHIQTTSGGTNIVTFAPAKQYSSVIVSSPAFTSGLSCQLYSGGSCTGTPVDGLYQGGTYTPGTLTNTFTTNSTVTNVNAP